MQARAALCPVQIGREREVEDVAQACDAVADTGSGGLLLISGEAGVGKSRLASEAIRLAAERSLGRLVGYCVPEAGAPYGPFATAIRRRIRTLEADQIRQLFDGPATLAAALVSEAAVSVTLPTTPPRRDDLFASVWQLLFRLARPTGALLLIEDLHWAEADTLNLLTYLAREVADLPVLVVGTYRRDELHRRHPLRAVLAQLDRERRYTEVALGPLEREDTRRMLSATFDGTDVGDEFLDVFIERTGGNPFFVEELAKVLVERGDIYAEAGDWVRRDIDTIEMPLTVRETLLSRTRDLDGTTRDILELAAVAGERLDLEVLGSAAGVDRDVVDEAIRAGLQAQLLRERQEGALTAYAFRHALTREALGEELVGPDKQRARRRLAEAIVAVHDDDLDAFAAELTDHFAAAGDVDAAIEYGLRAARRAAKSAAIEEAARQYDRVLQLVPEDAQGRLDLLLEGADAVIGGPERRLGVAFATEARALARTRGEPLREARAVRALEYERWLAGDGAGAIELCQEGLQLVRGIDEYDEAMAIRHLSRRLLLLDRADEAAALLPDGIALAERAGNLSALSGLHGTRLLLSGGGPDFDEAFEAALAAARGAGDIDAEANVTVNAGYILLWNGELRRSATAFERIEEFTEHYSVFLHDNYPRAGLVWLLALIGEYDAVDRHALHLRRASDIPTRLVWLTAAYEVAERRGDPGRAEVVDELLALALPTNESQRLAPALAAKARHVLLTDGLEAARPLFWEVFERTTGLTRSGSHWGFAPDFAQALAVAGNADELSSWVDAIGRLGKDVNPHNVASTQLSRGFLASLRGETTTARELLTDAAARYAAMPCPARAAEAWLGLADLELRSDRLDASSSAAGTALAIAERIGAHALTERAKESIGRTETVPVLATVLVTDIVGSTARASELGDRGWREVLERHHALVRRELSRFDGREIDTVGDGFLAAFASPAQAIRCAIAARDALAQIGVPIRAGVHTGECQQSGEKLTGIAVHIAARVASTAETGAVFVSGTVRDLLAGSGFQFEPEGEHEFKGVPGSWRLFSVKN
ncbi:MAG: AAA family ATPase [Actinomycetes bacterium]